MRYCRSFDISALNLYGNATPERGPPPLRPSQTPPKMKVISVCVSMCSPLRARPKPLPTRPGVFSHSTSSHSCIRAAFRPNLPVHSPRQSDTVLTDLRDSVRRHDFWGLHPFFSPPDSFCFSEMNLVQEKYMSYGNFSRGALGGLTRRPCAGVGLI